VSARDPAVGVVQERGGSHQLFVGKCVCEEKE
jgi:hypothetical protein